MFLATPALASAAPSELPSRSPSLHLISSFAIERGESPAKDLRFTGKATVALARVRDGVEEVQLETGLPKLRQLAPEVRAFGRRPMHYFRLAVSDSHLVASPPAQMVVWRGLTTTPEGGFAFESRRVALIEDLDLRGDRLAWIGQPHVPYGETTRIDRAGEVWTARLANEIEDRRLLSYDAKAATAVVETESPLSKCALLGISALRFLADGSLFAAPGSADQARRYDSAGNVLDRWDLRLLGLTTPDACAKLEAEEVRKLSSGEGPRAEWINQHRVIDEALALPEGPALVVREMRDGRPHWRLLILADAVESFEIPIADASPYDRLRGDARGGRIALLQVRDDRAFDGKPKREIVSVFSLPSPERKESR